MKSAPRGLRGDWIVEEIIPDEIEAVVKLRSTKGGFVWVLDSVFQNYTLDNK